MQSRFNVHTVIAAGTISISVLISLNLPVSRNPTGLNLVVDAGDEVVNSRQCGAD